MADLHLLDENVTDDVSDETPALTTSRSAISTRGPRIQRKGKKSGSARAAEDIVVRDILWPHYVVLWVPPVVQPTMGNSH